MEGVTTPEEQPTRRRSDHRRLESWKAIANYFNRSIRTVRRWEASENLPIHRHQHSKGFSVYAYPSELAEWRDRQNPSRSPEKTSNDNFSVRKRLSLMLSYSAVAIVGVLVGGFGAKWIFDNESDTSAIVASTDVQHLLTLMWQGDHVHSQQDIARTVAFPAIAAWNSGDPETAVKRIQHLRKQFPTIPVELRSLVAGHLADVSLAMGRVNEANELLVSIENPAARHELEAVVMFASGRRDELKDHFAAGLNYEEPMSAFLLTIAGLELPVEPMEGNTLVGSLSAAQSNVIQGIVAAGEGHQDSAKLYFQKAVESLEARDQAYFFIGPDMLSKVLQAEGDLSRAIEMLEQTMPRRRAAAMNRSGIFWLMCQRNLAKLYREAGRKSDATRIETELRELLDFADESFPLRVSLNQA